MNWGLRTRFYATALGLILGLSVSSAQAMELKDFEPPTDKAAHFGAAATAQTVCYTLGKAITGSKWGSAITCFVAINAAGAVKEYTDPYRGRHREFKDIYANLAGSGLSATLLTIGF